tara:strand:+ start:282912 stop:283451 length:540 start_codon:yes stop_codon:yes gene_type:complete
MDLRYYREIPDFLPREQCLRIVRILESKDNWKEAIVINRDGSTGPSKNRKQLTVRDQEADEEENGLGHALHARMKAEIKEIEKYGEPVLWQFQKNRAGDYFGWHEDSSPARPLEATCILYLSDEKSHELQGGATELRQGSRSVLIEPEVGKLVVFCSKNPHRGQEVRNGLKYAFVSCFN